MAKLPYINTGSTISVVIDSRHRVVDKSSINFDKLAAALAKPDHDVELIRSLVDINHFVAKASFGAVQISDDEVRWNGAKVHNVIADRLADLLRAGHDLAPLANFLDKLLTNPIQSAVDELYLWMQSSETPLPITPDGDFLAFKKVRGDYKDLYTGKFDNSVGAIVSIPRDTVDPDRHNTCSVGLHFCSYSYLNHYGTSSGARVVILKINPANVIAIPADYNNQKGRTWLYLVVGEVPLEEAEQFFRSTPVVNPVFENAVPDDDDESGNNDNDFNIDDIVTAITANNGVAAGDIGEVIDVDNSDGTVKVNFVAHGGVWLDPDDLDFFSFSVGDRVIVICDDGIPSGTRGVIIAVDDSDNTVQVEYLAEDGTKIADWQDMIGVRPETEEDIAEEEAAVGATHLFTHGSRSFLSSEIVSLVQQHGQRGTSRLTGIPRSTLQGWINQIDA